LNAAKKIILLLWLVLVASHGNASALPPGAMENRIWEKSWATLETLPARPLQTTGLHQENGSAGYDFAPDSLLAAKTPLGVFVENSAATGKASKELAQSLLELGPRPPGSQAAHIVPTHGHIRNDFEAVKGFVTAQTKMDTFLPGMRNHGVNGFWETPGHLGTHKDIYYRALGQEFKDVASSQEALSALDNIRVRIIAGEFK